MYYRRLNPKNKFSLILLMVFMIFSIQLTNVFSQVQIEPEDLLQMSLEKLMNIEVITASLTPQVAFDAPATVYVITEEQIKTRGYSNLEELLEDIPEIQVQNKTNATTYNFFSLRGIGGNEKFIILMDGIRINPTAGDPIHIGYNYSIANANRVEVILGPVSALYGADAYSGVINIITKHGNEIKKNKVVVSYGSFNASDNSCVVGLGNDDISLSLTGSYYHSSEADFPDIFKGDYDWYNKEYKTNGNVLTFSGDTQTLSNIEEYNIDKRAYFINGRFKLRNFEFGYMRNSTDYSTSLSQKTAYALRSDDAHNEYVIQTLYASHNYLSKNEKLILQSVFSHGAYELAPSSAFHNIYTSYQPGYGYASDASVKFKEQLSYEFNDNFSLITSFSYENINSLPKVADLPVKFDKDKAADNQNLYYIGSNVIDSNGRDFSIPRDFYYLEYQDYGSFLQLQTKLLSIFKFTMGCRYDYNSRYGSTLNPRLSLIFSPLDKMNIKLLYGQASLSPSPFKSYQYFGSFYAVRDSLGNISGLESSFWHSPNPELEPEKLRTYEASASYFISDNFLISANAYYNEITDLIALEYTFNEEFKGVYIKTVERQVNKGTSSTYGGTVRLDSRFKLGNSLTLNSYLSYSYTDGDIDGGDIRYNTNNIIKGNLDAILNKLSLSSRFIYRSETKYTEYIGSQLEDFTNDPLFLLNMYFRYKAYSTNRFSSTIFIKVHNLFNKKYYDVEKEGTLATFGRVPQDPLSIQVGLKILFK